MKKILALILIIAVITFVTVALIRGNKEYQENYNNAIDTIVIDGDGASVELKGAFFTYYQACVDGDCYNSDIIVYSNVYGDGVHIVLNLRERNFMKQMLTTIFGGNIGDEYPLHYATIYIGGITP